MGLVIAIYGGLIILANAMGSLIMRAFDFLDELNHTDESMPMQFLFRHYLEISVWMIVLGAGYLIGGLFLRKCKRWAALLISVISCLLIAVIWKMDLAMYAEINDEPVYRFIGAAIFGSGIFWTAIFCVLVWFLNKKSTRQYLH